MCFLGVSLLSNIVPPLIWGLFFPFVSNRLLSVSDLVHYQGSGLRLPPRYPHLRAEQGTEWNGPGAAVIA